MLGSRPSGGRLFCVKELRFQCLHPAKQLRQFRLQHRHPTLEEQWNRRIAIDEAARRYIDRNSRTAARLRAFSDRDVAADPGLSAQYNVVFEFRAAGNSDLRA